MPAAILMYREHGEVTVKRESSTGPGHLRQRPSLSPHSMHLRSALVGSVAGNDDTREA